MKKILCFTVLLLLSITSLLANPVFPVVNIQEFSLVNGNWQIEVIGEYLEQYSLNNCYIKCNVDSAYFNDDINILPNTPLSISQTDLQSQLSINPEEDNLIVYYFTEYGYEASNMRYGSIENNALAPLENQSLHKINIQTMQFEGVFRFALDNTPFTNEGDPEAHMGNFQGYIYDHEMNPLPNATIDYMLCPYDLDPIIADENGWYERSVNSMIYDFHIDYSNVTIDSTIAILPEVINRYDFVLPFVSGSQQVEVTPLRYNTSNSPNPFNPDTTISFGRILEQPAKIKIYNSKGALVDKLDCSSGKESISWDAVNTASGVYFYKLEVEGNEAGNGKMLLLK